MVSLGGTGSAAAPIVKLSANSLSFSNQWVGASFTAPNITLSNSGTAALSLTGISITGADATSFAETNTCGTSVAAGGSCTIAVTFKPAAAGALTGALSVADNASGSPQTVSLSGTGNTVVLSATSLTYSSSAVGDAAPAQIITLTNKSNVALAVTSIGVTGTNASAFTQTNTCGTSVAAAASCSITVTFTPTAAGTLTASISIADNAYGSPQTVALTGAVAAVSLAPTGIGFVTTPIGVASAARNLTLSNKGTAAIPVTGISITGAGAASYSQTNTCGTSIAAAASCVIAVTFKPAATGLQSAIVSVADGAGGPPQMATLSGAGTAVSLSAASITYPSTGIGIAAPTQAVTLTNKATTALAVSGISIAGTGATSFAQTNNCGTSVAAGASCAITVAFKPAASGALTATITVADNAYGAKQTIALTGAGSAANVSPTSLSYGTTGIGVAAVA